MYIPLNKLLIILGILFIVLGGILSGKIYPLGRLPGDIYFSNGRFSFYFPLATSLILSVVISLIFWVLKR